MAVVKGYHKEHENVDIFLVPNSVFWICTWRVNWWITWELILTFLRSLHLVFHNGYITWIPPTAKRFLFLYILATPPTFGSLIITILTGMRWHRGLICFSWGSLRLKTYWSLCVFFFSFENICCNLLPFAMLNYVKFMYFKNTNSFLDV